MKKSLLALAVLGAYAGLATAQSSVTLFGIVDLNARYVKNDGQSRRISLSQDGINSSRLGFRGIEDLGGGLRAGFWLEAGINPDTGVAGSATGGKFFNRRSTVSLINQMGELRLGRDYTPTFWNQTIFDAFGTNGLGSSTNVAQIGTSVGVRQDNSIGYFLPSNIGGFYGQAMVGAGESGTTLDRPGRHISGRIGFAAGPFDIAASIGHQRYATTNERQKTYNVGGSYDFGFLKLLGYYQRDDYDLADAKETRMSISTLFKMGQGEIHLGYDRDKLDVAGGDSTVDQIKATYQYNLSKRTAMYGTVSRLANKDLTSSALGGGFTPITPGGDSKGFEVGLRHIF